MKNVVTYTLVFVSIISQSLFSQQNVGIGTLTPNANAALEIESNDRGVLIPRLSTIQRTTYGGLLTNAENSMLVYDMQDSIFYYWKGTYWEPIPGVNSDNQNLDSAKLNPVDSVLTIWIEDGLPTSVDLKSVFDNKDEQTLSIIGDSLEISNGNRVLFIDNDTTNETLDSVRYLNDTLYVYENDSLYKTEIVGGEWNDADKIGLADFIYAKQALNNGAADTVVITDDGKMGIGTSVPQSNITIDDITGDGNNAMIRLNEKRPAYTGGANLKGVSFAFNDSVTTTMGTFTRSTVGAIDQTEYFYINVDSNSVPKISASNEVDFVVDSKGDVGIGVRYPTAKLTLEEDNVTIFMKSIVGGGGNQGISSDGNLFLGGESNTYIVSDMNAGAAPGDIIFGDRVLGYNTADAGGWAIDDEHMRIDGATGNVGIGTNNPNGKLSVYGQTSVVGASMVAVNEPHIVFGDALGGGNLSYVTGFDDGLLLGGNPTEYFNAVATGAEPRSDVFIDDAGRVGMSNNNPGTTLNVGDAFNPGTGFKAISIAGDGVGETRGAKLFMGADQTNFAQQIYQTTGAVPTLRLNHTVAGVLVDDEQLVLSGDGNTGIGTIVPSVKLDVAGDVSVGKHYDFANTGGVAINDTYGDRLYFSGVALNTDDIYMSRYNASLDVSELRLKIGDNEGTANNDAFVIGSSRSGIHPWKEYFRVQSNGFVNIGTSTLAAYPTNQLHIQGGSNPLRLEGLNVGAASDSILSVDITGVVRKVEQVFLPPGMISPFSTAGAPAGWLEADGREVSRTVYANLFAAIGTMYGVGDGVTTFNLPDYRGQFLRGITGTSGNDPDVATRTNRGDGTVGNNVGTKQANEIQSHEHALKTSTGTPGVDIVLADDPAGNGGDWEQTTPNAVPWAGSPQALTFPSGGAETRPKNVYVLYCIKF